MARRESRMDLTLGTGVALGAGVGVAFGFAWENPAIGVALGIALGGAIALVTRRLKKPNWVARDRSPSGDHEIYGKK